jgi:glycosyltransferase involved in cell wall biosynthesis
LIVSLIDKEIFSLTVPGKTQTYIAARKPIIAIIEGEAANLIKENGLGFVAKPNDINGIKNVFEQAINTFSEEIEALIEKSDLLSETVFNKDQILNNLLQLVTKEAK